MKAISQVKSGKLIAVIAMPLALGALWWGPSSHAEAGVTVGSDESKVCFVQDKSGSSVLDLMLLVHRPGWVMPVAPADASS